MDGSYWQARWQQGQTGFHLPRPHPKLLSLWPTLAPNTAATVFVPLCGKSLDMVWLAERGHAVVGVELSELAVRAFFAEQALTPAIQTFGDVKRFSSGPYSLYCGDFFALTQAQLPDCHCIYDRAALVALPPALRQRYAHQLRVLLPHATMLLLTLVYPQAEMAGPPFSVSADEVRELYAGAQLAQLIEHDILAHEPRFMAKGVTRLTELAWSVQW
ncbi:MAG: thiopurine S-methyltransferase [Pseudomonadota bacterium]